VREAIAQLEYPRSKPSRFAFDQKDPSSKAGVIGSVRLIFAEPSKASLIHPAKVWLRQIKKR